MGKVISGGAAKSPRIQKFYPDYFQDQELSGSIGPSKPGDPEKDAAKLTASRAKEKAAAAKMNAAFENTSAKDFEVDSPLPKGTSDFTGGKGKGVGEIVGKGTYNQVKLTGSDPGNFRNETQRRVTKYNTNTSGKTSWGQISDNKDSTLHPPTSGNYYQSQKGRERVKTIKSAASASSLSGGQKILSDYKSNTENFNRSGYGGKGSDISITAKQPKPKFKASKK